MNTKFISKRLLLAYAIALALGTYFVASGIDYFITLCVGDTLPIKHAYINCGLCVICGFTLVGAARGLYEIYLRMVKDQMHDAHTTIREIHNVNHICDSYVGIWLICIVMLTNLLYRAIHFMDYEVILVLDNPFSLFFGPLALALYGMYLIYRGNKKRSKK